MNNPELLGAAAETMAMMARTVNELADGTISDPWNEWRLYSRAVTGYDVAADLFEEAGKPAEAKKARTNCYDAKVARRTAAHEIEKRAMEAAEADARKAGE